MTINPTADLGSALLIVEFEEGYAPIALVSTLREAQDFASEDMARRTAIVSSGADSPCPTTYKVWHRGFDGKFEVIAEIPA